MGGWVGSGRGWRDGGSSLSELGKRESLGAAAASWRAEHRDVELLLCYDSININHSSVLLLCPSDLAVAVPLAAEERVISGGSFLLHSGLSSAPPTGGWCALLLAPPLLLLRLLLLC